MKSWTLISVLVLIPWFQDISTDGAFLCRGAAVADIVILVDGSWSIGTDNFRLVKSFLENLVQAFNVDFDQIRIEATVSCLYNSSCFLSCNHKHGKATIIHWDYMTGGDFSVHSFVNEKDQLEVQDPRFKNRTSLVEDQDTGSKTTLLLENVKVEDEGEYRCYTDSKQHGWKPSFVLLQVDAPVQRVDIVRTGNSTTCSSEGVYPEPELTWSSSHQSSSTVQQTEEKLYNISSSLKLSDMDGDLLLSCTVSTRLNKWTTTWRNPIVTNTSRAQISCSHMNTSLKDLSLVWRFNHTHVIMRRNRTDVQHVSAQWKQHVEAEEGSDILHLQNLSSDQEGTYSCELSRVEETTVTHTLLWVDMVDMVDMVNMVDMVGIVEMVGIVNIMDNVEINKGCMDAVVGGVVGAFWIIAVIIVIGVLVVRWKRRDTDQSFSHWLSQMTEQRSSEQHVSYSGTITEMQPMNSDASTSQ